MYFQKYLLLLLLLLLQCLKSVFDIVMTILTCCFAYSLLLQQTLDLMYRVLDSTELDQCKAQGEKSGEKKKREKSASRRSKSQEKYRTIDTSKDSDHRSVASSKKSDRNKVK